MSVADEARRRVEELIGPHAVSEMRKAIQAVHLAMGALRASGLSTPTLLAAIIAEGVTAAHESGCLDVEEMVESVRRSWKAKDALDAEQKTSKGD